MLDLPNSVLKSAFDRRGKDGIELPNTAQQTGQQLLQREHIRSECFNLFVCHCIEVRVAAGQQGRLLAWYAAARSCYLTAEAGARKLCWKGYRVWLLHNAKVWRYCSPSLRKSSRNFAIGPGVKGRLRSIHAIEISGSNSRSRARAEQASSIPPICARFTM